MAGQSRYKLAKEFISKLSRKYKKVSLKTLKQYIAVHLGADDKRCIIPYMRIMSDSGLIKEISEGTYTLHPNTEFDL